MNSKCAIHYLWFSFLDTLSIPSLMVLKVTESLVEYKVEKGDDLTNPMIIGHEVFRFGVPMIGKYANTGARRKFTISPAVPGTQYRITVWALHVDGNRSATLTADYASTKEACE